MVKRDLVNSIAAITQGTKKDAELHLDAFIQAVEKALVKGEKVQLIGFATLEVVETAERIGRNPQTREEFTIPKSKRVKFKAGKDLKDKVKGL